MNINIKLLIIFLIIPHSFEDCHKSCKTCYDIEFNNTNMQCKSCQKGLNLLFKTTNCVNPKWYINYFINKTDSTLYPCSLLNNNCYECNPYNNTKGKCLSCNKGYKYNQQTEECIKCDEDTEYAYIVNDFYGCHIKDSENFCNKFITYCKNKNSLENIKCPDELPFFNILSNSCEGNECYENGYKNGTCLIKNEKYIDRVLTIKWFINEPKYVMYPSYNTDKSGNLFIELSCDLEYTPEASSYSKKKFRKFYFFDKDGRGYFNVLNDEYEKTINIRRKSTRYFSTSIALKNKSNDEYSFFLNLEGMDYNLEFMDLKTFELTSDDLFDVSSFYGFVPNSVYIPSISLLELNEKNQYLMSMYLELINSDNYDRDLYFILFVFNIEESNGEKIDVNSLNFSLSSCFGGDFNLEMKFFVIQTKNSLLVADIISAYYRITLVSLSLFKNDFISVEVDTVFKWAFHKLLHLKDEILLLCYYSNYYRNHDTMVIYIIELWEDGEDREFYGLLYFTIKTEKNEGTFWWDSDIICINENRVVFSVQKMHGRRISIYLIDFFDDYESYIINKFFINTYDYTINVGNRYAILFLYKEILGYQIETTEGENGFILFGYYNSTDPKQILNLKADGLNYVINLGDYLNLQTNIFKYEVKYIKIVEIPNNESGLFLISNNNRKVININDTVDINTEIYLSFAYNNIIKKGNYLFKFVGVLQEPTFDKISKYSDELITNIDEDIFSIFTDSYNERRNLNITGKVALVQINVQNDTKVFCDKKYDASAIKTDKDKLLTCGKGIFYDVKNDNEITQLNLGMNYHFDTNQGVYIKCHKRCKTCSREYNETNMNCDKCYDNYYLRNGFCLEISKCDYNYFYDENYNLNCINRNFYCPDFKPYEDKITKECIEKCNIDDYINKCNPTNNFISINETYKQILNENYYSKIESTLFKMREKYAIYGNNVSFIFTTSEKEKEELLNNTNYSSIILGECENILKSEYSIHESIPLPILKIETLDNHSDYMNVFYEVFNPFNFSQKLDLELCDKLDIEIRVPIVIDEYKFDLISKTKESGYNIFDSNDSFYIDICSVFSYNNSDVSLSERRGIIDLSNENLCMSECSASNIDIVTLRSICICKIHKNNTVYSEESTKITNITSSDDNLFNFLKKSIDISKSSNIKVVKCFKKIFSLSMFSENYGFYILLFMNIFNIIIFAFSPIKNIEKKLNKYCLSILEQMKKVYQNIKNKDQNTVLNLNNNETDNGINIQNNLNVNKKSSKKIGLTTINKIEIKNNFSDKDKNSDIHNYSDIINDIDNNNNNRNIDNIIDNKNNFNERLKNNDNLILKNNNITSKKQKKRRDIKNKTNKVVTPHTIDLSLSYRKMNSQEIKNPNLNLNIINNEIYSKEKEEKEKQIYEELKKKDNSDYYIYCLIKNFKFKSRKYFLSESEIENLDYKYALQIDNRNNGDYYFSLLKEKNKIISIFLNKTDNNIQAVKVSLFLFNFTLSLTTNALFFNDEAIHQINQEQGSYNLKNQISTVIYSAIISTAIGFIIEYFALTQKDILNLRNKKEIKEVENLIPDLIKKLKLRFKIYFAMTIIINIIFWYYICAFCAIYSMTQTHMISDSLISFLLSISYSILLSLISSIIRVFSLKKQSKLRHFFYTISWILSLI